jgi:glycosyltransferase involved in cell wall biosynthesis
MTADGTVYPYPASVFEYAVWRRYLDVFDHVVVFARVRCVQETPASASLQSTGPGVSFYPLPDYLGPWQYCRHYTKLKILARQILQNQDKDACILRVPGNIGGLLWNELYRVRRPYGVEVVGDPWDVFAPGSVKTILRPILRRKMRWELARQCHMASAASYVTERNLQKRYPANCWSTHYSSIELPAELIIDEAAINKRIQRIRLKSSLKEPWHICYVGTMSQLYKGQHILLDAVRLCIRKGINLKLTMLGDGQFRPQLEQQAQKLSIFNRVKFMGQLPPGQAVIEHLDAADMFVLPSLTEGLPRSIIEAMARGLPCITTNVGGFPEVVESQYMVKPDDSSDLAETIAKTISNVEEMKRLVKKSVEIASKYRSDVLQKRRVRFCCELRDITQDWLNNRKE